jgi:uncharacterized alpha-E superfamily protein
VRDERLIHWLAQDDPVTILDDLIKRGLQYYGTADITMSRGAGHSFINIGKFLERSLQSVDILDVKLNNKDFSIESNDTIYWKYLLMSISGYELYLKTYRKGFEPRNVIEQIVLNNDFPRSVLHSLHKVYNYLNRVEGQMTPEAYKQLEMLIGKLRSRVQYSTVDNIMEQGLSVYLHSVKDELYNIANALDQNCFAHS